MMFLIFEPIFAWHLIVFKVCVCAKSDLKHCHSHLKTTVN
jgi:hypothetical protein